MNCRKTDCDGCRDDERFLMLVFTIMMVRRMRRIKNQNACSDGFWTYHACGFGYVHVPELREAQLNLNIAEQKLIEQAISNHQQSSAIISNHLQ